MIILTRDQIEARIDLAAAVPLIEDAYRATSAGRVNLPPVGHITFPDHADCHIKYGHLQGAATFVIKVATGFPANTTLGLSTGNGLVLVMSAKTGQAIAVLHDEMRLTDVRTGLGGAIATRTLARPGAKRVLIVGTGPQARCQLEAHMALLPDDVTYQVWGRKTDRAGAVTQGTPARVAPDLEQAARTADAIVTCTGAIAPLIRDAWITPGTHITAVGADAPGKQELEVDLVARADHITVDLTAQCLDHGEVSHAHTADRLGPVTELGAILSGTAKGRTTADQITIADLTGIAAQDIAMANAILAT